MRFMSKVLSYSFVFALLLSGCSNGDRKPDEYFDEHADRLDPLKPFGVDYLSRLADAERGDSESKFYLWFAVNPQWLTLPESERCERRFKEMLPWLKASAFDGYPRAISLMADYFDLGSEGFPKNENMANCLREAQRDESLLESCKVLEKDISYPGFHMVTGKNGKRTCGR